MQIQCMSLYFECELLLCTCIYVTYRHNRANIDYTHLAALYIHVTLLLHMRYEVRTTSRTSIHHLINRVKNLKKLSAETRKLYRVKTTSRFMCTCCCICNCSIHCSELSIITLFYGMIKQPKFNHYSQMLFGT